MDTSTRSQQSPRFTLVLGSGGVKSIAGLGAVEVLEAEGLRPSGVVGCSAGALFGALIAAGHRVRGRLLVDGSLSDPLPLGNPTPGYATVALGFRVPFPRNAHTASRLATRITASLSNNLLDARVAAADQAKLLVMLPELPRRIGLFDTEAMPELLELGRQAARAALPRLHAMLGQSVRLAAAG